MAELGSYGSVRGARGNSRPCRESHCGQYKTTRMPQSDIAPSHLMSVGAVSSSLCGRNFAEFPHLLCLSIASSSSSSDRGEMPSIRNPGKLSEAVVSICISST
jgi:hypothetical protein